MKKFLKRKGSIKELIKQVKYKFVADMGEEIVELVGKVERVLPSPVLIPIPLAEKRWRWRGFNQSELLGKMIAKKNGWGFESMLLKRVKTRGPQVGLTMKERKENIRGVFAVNQDKRKENENVILFDDVWTTGATMKEAARVLKRAGVSKVWGLVLAR